MSNTGRIAIDDNAVIRKFNQREHIELGLTGYQFLGETVHKQEHKIDYIGSTLIFISISALLVVLIQAGTVWSWLSAIGAKKEALLRLRY